MKVRGKSGIKKKWYKNEANAGSNLLKFFQASPLTKKSFAE